MAIAGRHELVRYRGLRYESGVANFIFVTLLHFYEKDTQHYSIGLASLGLCHTEVSYIIIVSY